MGVLALTAIGACTAITSPNDDDIRCTVTATRDPCAEIGRICERGVCVLPTAFDAGTRDAGGPDASCQPTGMELCGGGDEDCDNRIDEGQDLDEDGFTWCGGGDLTKRDCDDSNPMANPDAEEVCDGIDNDCDSATDESMEARLCEQGLDCIRGRCVDPEDCSQEGVACAPMERCDLEQTPPRCVESTGGCTGGACGPGLICDEVRDRCVAPQPLGASCETDAECARGSCLPQGIVGVVPEAERICSRVCCADEDCADGTICWGNGSGVSLCVTPEAVGRSGRGVGTDGEGCDDDDDCGSGVCSGGACVRNCRREGDCASGRACRVTTRPTDRLTCQVFGVAGAGQSQGGSCATLPCGAGPAYCLSSTLTCSGPCRTSADCASVGVDYFCGWGQLGNSNTWVTACLPKRHSGSGATGDPCSSNEECADAACIDDRCGAACCWDTCPEGSTCRPVIAGSHFQSHCVE